MSLYWSSCISQGTRPWNSMLHSQSSSAKRKSTFSTYKSLNSEVISRRSTQLQAQPQWSFISGSRLVPLRRQQDPRITHHHKIKGSTVSASFVADYDIATSAFTWGTVAVLPFYTLMVVAPNSQLTQRVMKSSMPYILLGILYAYLVYLSWSPSILQTLFASKYWLPELPGILKLFSSEMTMASAWIHYLVVDLFAARQIYHDGMRNKIGTWHSICLCLMCCPVGIISHETTKALLNRKQK